MGTAMGPKIAPQYTNLFRGHPEEEFLDKCTAKPMIYLRYIDAIFILWRDDLSQHVLYLIHCTKCPDNNSVGETRRSLHSLQFKLPVSPHVLHREPRHLCESKCCARVVLGTSSIQAEVPM